MESTGGYENKWYRSLRARKADLGLEVYRLNPVGVKHQAKSEMTRTITDPVAAKTIGIYLVDKYEKIMTKSEPDSINDRLIFLKNVSMNQR